jgi:hypothetical protein
MLKTPAPRHGTPEWRRANILELCRARSADPVVFDFIAHNWGASAAHAALDALPIAPAR